MLPRRRKATHPGTFLAEEFLKPLGLSQVALAANLGVPVQRIRGLVNGKRPMDVETAVLLAHALKTTPEFWTNLQVNADLSAETQKLAAKQSRAVARSRGATADQKFIDRISEPIF